MAAVTGTVIGAVGVASSIKGARDQSKAAKDAARIQGRAADASTEEQRRQFDLARQDTAPFRQVGTAAINQLARLYGLDVGAVAAAEQAQAEPETSMVGDTVLPVEGRRIVPVGQGRYQVYYGDMQVGDLVPGGKNGRFIGNGQQIPVPVRQPPMQGSANQLAMGPAGKPDYSGFFDSPDYAFARDEGIRGIERSAAARGGLASGNTLASLSRFNSGLATQNYGNYVNRLAALAGVGQTSSEGLADRRGQLAGNVSNNFLNAANSRASGITGSAGTFSNLGNQLAGVSGFLTAQPRRTNNMLTGEQINNIFRPQNPYLTAA